MRSFLDIPILKGLPPDPNKPVEVPKKRVLTVKERIEIKKRMRPPKGQLCENGCGNPARFHVMRVVKTSIGRTIQWYWACSRHYMKCPSKKEEAIKIKTATTQERYGCEHHMQDKTVVEKREQTYISKYGVPHPIQDPEVMKRKLISNIINHTDKKGKRIKVSRTFLPDRVFPMQDPEIQKTVRDKRGSSYLFPSGREVKVMGFEPDILNELLEEGIKEEDILIGEECPHFDYFYKGKNRKFFPSILVKSKNLIIDVKTTYTYHKDLRLNFLLKELVEKQGYRFEFRIKYPKMPDKTITI